MLIVIDLSKKLVGFNLFENFFYNLKNSGTLCFANNPLTVEKDEIDYNELKENVQNILYNHHANTWSLCVLYDMSEQKKDPLKYSIASNIQSIKEKIITPLSIDYTFDKLYYFSLDSIQRNCDWLPLDENIKNAIDFDSKGYISKKINHECSEILISAKEIEQMDKLWEEIKNKSLSTNSHLESTNLKQMMTEIKQGFCLLFEPKITAINEKYPDLLWYSNKLSNVYQSTLTEFENKLYKYASSINSIQTPSEMLKNALKMEVSTYSEAYAILIRINLIDHNPSLNREVLNYRHQLEIIAILIYLATNDTKLIFDRNKPTERENHWEITTFLNEEILCQMLYSYHLKLKTELAKIGKFTNAEIEYQEFSPKTFNLAREMKKPELPTILSIKTFPNKRDSQNIENFSETLYNRYLEGIELANKRLRELTIKLRIQKESSSSGKIKKANILEMNAEITEMQNEIKELQQKIAFYHPKEIITVDPFLKVEYDKFVKEIQTMMSNRIEKTTFIKNLLLILTTSVCIYPFLYLTNPYDISQLILLFLILIIPSGIYTMLQMKYSIRTKNKITKKISEFINYNEKTINDLFCNDKETAIYVQNIYNLIMLKKYVNECNSKLLEHSKKLKQLNYHYAKLKEHIETNNRLLEILAIKNSVIEPIKTDKINELDIEKTFEKNSLYCPLNYLLLVDNIKNKATINQEQNVDINSNLIGFVEKFIITYDKEYHHD